MSDPSTPSPAAHDITASPVPSNDIGESFWQQPELEERVAEDGNTLVVEYFGPWDAVKAYSAAFSIGIAHAGDTRYTLAERILKRERGPSGRLTLKYSDNAGDAQDGGGTAARAKKTIWRLSSTPADVSVYRYCGPSSQNANRARIERWWNNPGDDPEASLGDLSANDQVIARKLLEGKETVQRHFPTLVKQTVYTKGQITPTGELDHFSTSVSGAPAWMSGRAAYWLKQQEDCEVSDEGTQTLVESWIGGAGFDENFYGDAPQSGTTGRWEFGTI